MVVQHNLTAMNSNRMLNITAGKQAKATEKLSSGYKINRAADDAAGLSISEKMRKQIRGLTQASANAQDGISCVQTAEGALNEVQDMLQRMNELAVKSANGTNSEDDRTYIQNEIDQLVSEIDRVAETTKFNETYLLKGDDSKSETRFTYVATAARNAELNGYGIAGTPTGMAVLDSKVYGLSSASASEQNALMSSILANGGISLTSDGTTITAVDVGSSGYSFSVSVNKITLSTSNGTAVGTFDYKVYGGGSLGTGTFKTTMSYDKDGSGTTGPTFARDAGDGLYDKDGNWISENALHKYLEVTETAGVTYARQREDATVYDKWGNEIVVRRNEYNITTVTGSMEIGLHVGADATRENQISVSLAAMSAKGIGVDGLKVDGANADKALKAIETIKAGIQIVSTQRSALGAVQNRLEHTINNLDNVVENTTSAESAIRDTDMATQMVQYSNNNILAQAGQAMLAQADQSNQGVLSLLG